MTTLAQLNAAVSCVPGRGQGPGCVKRPAGVEVSEAVIRLEDHSTISSCNGVDDPLLQNATLVILLGDRSSAGSEVIWLLRWIAVREEWALLRVPLAQTQPSGNIL